MLCNWSDNKRDRPKKLCVESQPQPAAPTSLYQCCKIEGIAPDGDGWNDESDAESDFGLNDSAQIEPFSPDNYVDYDSDEESALKFHRVHRSADELKADAMKHSFLIDCQCGLNCNTFSVVDVLSTRTMFWGNEGVSQILIHAIHQK